MPKWLSRVLELLGITGIIQLAIWLTMKDAEMFEGMTLIEIFSHPLHWLYLGLMTAGVLWLIRSLFRHGTEDDIKEIKEMLSELLNEIRADRNTRNDKQ